ncbi:MAG: adaptor protein MecA [Lachnospiraceae bacterium]|nr:adaptor protein MecA [Lachnospiraceae bacterium]
MKIEKLNENQIRCTLTKEDLARRQLKISELAYGTEKAKSLFRDMMRQANYEFGFEAEDIPLMIEAVPLNAECLVLIITKVEDPEELDTRFSRFAPSIHEDTDIEEDEASVSASDEVLDLFRKIENHDETSRQLTTPPENAVDNNLPIRLFCFSSMRPLLSLSTGLQHSFTGTSVLYRDSKSKQYLLLLTPAIEDLQDFNKLCNRLSEYGTILRVLPTTEAYLTEHCETIIAKDALMTLSNLST